MQLELRWDKGEAVIENIVADISEIPVTPPVGGGMLEIKISLPLTDVQGIWSIASDGGPYRCMPWNVDFTCGAQSNFPFIAFFNRASLLRGAVGLTNGVDDSKFHAAMNQEKCTYDLTISIVTVPETPPFAVFVDLRRDVNWMESLAYYRRLVCPVVPEFPAGAWEPVFCTWYAAHAAISAQWVEDMVPRLLECGFRTLILDDGWCYDEAKRVSPETLPVWYRDVGDWEISTKKFPDFPGHIKRVQQQGLKYMLWVAPHFFGVNSRAYAEFHPRLVPDINEGVVRLDVAEYDMVDGVCAKLRNLAKSNGLDGLKIDFIDVVPNSVEKPNGRDTLRLVEKLTSALKQDNPGALIEFRQGYATLTMMPYGTQFRAGDVPFDWMRNFRRMLQIRLAMGDGVPIHADPAYWTKDDTPENIARHMMVMLTGVPMLSMDLNQTGDMEKSIIRYWLDFYQANRTLLNYGSWQVVWFGDEPVAAIVENSSEKLVITTGCASQTEFAAADGKLLKVLNLASEPLPFAGAGCFDFLGRPVASGAIPSGGWGQR